MEGQQGHTEGAAPLLEGWLTRSEVSQEIGVSAGTLARWNTRRIGPPCARVGRRVLYRTEAVREWLLSRERGPIASKGARPGGGR
jgi:hypothetical protein